MSKLELIDKLQQILNDLKSITSRVDASITDLKRRIEEEKFIPSELSTGIINDLAEISSMQSDLENQFEILDARTLPESISEFSAVLNEYKEKAESAGRYIRALEFFLNIRSDDEEAQALIEQRKEAIRDARPENMDESELKEFAECYLWLYDVYREKDPERRFSLIYKIMRSFEEPISRAVHFDKLILPEETVQNEAEEITSEDEMTEEEPNDSDTVSADKSAQEAPQIEESEDVVKEEAENAVKEEGEDEETAEWKAIGIEEPDAVITREDITKLSTDQSPKASDKFGVEKFKKFILKQAPAEKVACMREALDGCGYTRKAISLWGDEEDGYFDFATDKLWQAGYLKRYTVKDLGEFYTLSTRGERAFASKEALSFINNHMRHKISPRAGGERIEDTANSAITRILAFKSFELVKRINPDYSFSNKDMRMATDFAFIGYPDVIDEKKLVFFGIASEDIGEFKNAYEFISGNQGGADQYVISDTTLEKAEAIAKWVLKVSGGSVSVWYYSITDDVVYDVMSGEVIALPFVTEDDEEVSEDLETVDIAEEGTSLDEIAPELEAGQEEASAEYQEQPNTEPEVELTPEEAPEAEDDVAPEEDLEEEDDAAPEETHEEVNDEASVEAVEDKDDVAPEEDIEAEDDSAPLEDIEEEDDSAPEEAPDEEEDAVADEAFATDADEESAEVEAMKEKAVVPERAVARYSANAASVSYYAPASEEKKQMYKEEYEKMLAAGRYYGATAYLKALSKEIPYYADVYRQLAYALNDPMAGCSYSSDVVYSVYYGDAVPVSDYFTVSAVMRNFFYDQFSYDYSLQQLQAVVSGNQVLRDEPLVESVIYTLQKFKRDNHKGVDRYADYREKERSSWMRKLQETRTEARGYYENYCTGVKENASHKRFIETQKLILGPDSELSDFLQVVRDDDREMIDLLAEFLSQKYVKDKAEINEENIDPAKIEAAIDDAWNRAAQNIRLVKKSSQLMSSLRMNLYKRIDKVVAALCRYVFLIKYAIPNDEDPVLIEYKKIRQPLLDNITSAIGKLSSSQEKNLSRRAGIMVLLNTLRDFRDRIEGNYTEGDNRYFYINFLKNDKVMLDDDYLPVLDEVPELPEFSVGNRIIQHCLEPEREWGERIKEITRGGDDYGSAALILKYAKDHDIELKDFNYDKFSLDDAIENPRKDTAQKREEFIGDLELAQSYGQIDNTVENSKEAMIQVMDTWFAWANETNNFGFFVKILDQFKEKIHKDAQARAIELERNLAVYLAKTPDWDKDELISNAVQQVRDRIEQLNYAAAEDLLNRMLTNDLDFETDLQQTDYLRDFFNEYDSNYRGTSNPMVTLRSLVYSSRINKDTKGANRLLDSWPRGVGVSVDQLRLLLGSLGFTPSTIIPEAPLQGKIKSYLVSLQRPQNGRKSNYKHPIAAFGSEAEDKGFRVVCLFGKTDAGRLIDTFKEIGNAQNTIVLLDYALTMADRRTLARKTKTDLSGKTFAVIDRVVLVYLAKHYTDTAVNRMLMSVIMPFASYQPYIDKSADVMPQEIFIGRKAELEKIESPTGVNIVYGGRQLGKTALLRMAKKDIDKDENGDRAIIVNAWRKDYRKTARAISEALYDEKILDKENITEDWSVLARDIKNRLRDTVNPIPYFLLMIDEADVFIESCEEVGYQPFNELKDIQSIGSGRFKFVVAGLRNIVRFKRQAALSNNSVLTHLDSLTVKPFKAMEARELLEVPLSYLGFRFPNNNETEVLISTIFGTTNYFPGLIQLYCTKLIEAMRRDYAGYTESDTPPYYVQKEHIKKVLAEQTLQHDIRDKFFITLKVGDDDYYYIIALLAAYHYHDDKSHNGCTAEDLLAIADEFGISKLTELDAGKVTALMEEMTELNVLQHTGDGRYRFTRHSFCQMMGNMQDIEDELLNHYMEG